MTAEIYRKQIKIIPSEELIIDRSLDGNIFNQLTGYKAPSWKAMIEEMKAN